MKNKILIGVLLIAIIVIQVDTWRIRHEIKSYDRAIDTVYTGTTANDGTGMPLQTAFAVINDFINMGDSLGLDEMTAQHFTNLRHLIDSLNQVRQAINDSLNVWLTNAEEGVLAKNNNTLLYELRSLGADMVAIPVGAGQILASYTNMTDGRALYFAVYIPQDTTITGVKWVQRVAGVYTADNFNGVALYSLSGTTLTRVAISADDGDIWKATAYTLGTKAFSAPYSATAGMYFIGLLYNTSSESTAPSIYDWNTSSAVSQLITGGNKVSGYVASQTAFPADETAGDITAEGAIHGVWLY